MSGAAARQVPELLARVAEACGKEAALKLAQAHGGRIVYFPTKARLTASHPLAQLLGHEVALRLVVEIGSGHVMVPLGAASLAARQTAERVRVLSAAFAQGKSAQAAAREAGCHLCTAVYWRKKLRLEDRQLDLFASS